MSSPATIESELAASTRSVKDSGESYVVNYKQAAMESSKLVTGTLSPQYEEKAFIAAVKERFYFGSNDDSVFIYFWRRKKGEISRSRLVCFMAKEN